MLHREHFVLLQNLFIYIANSLLLYNLFMLTFLLIHSEVLKFSIMNLSLYTLIFTKIWENVTSMIFPSHIAHL